MSSSDQPAASGPKLFNRLKKSLSGQNLSKANQDAQNGTQDVDAQDTVAEEIKGEEREGANAVEKDNDTEASVETETVEHTVTEDTASGKASDDAADSHTAEDSIQSASEQEPVHKKEKVTGLQRLKSLTKFSKGGHRSAKPSEHTAQTPTGTITEGESEIATQHDEGDGDAAAPVSDAVTVETGSSELGTTEDVKNAAAAQPTREASDASGLSEGDENNDPTSLADIIRNLVESLPHPTEPAPVPSKPKLPQLDTSGRPILPPDAVHIDDKKLIAKLRNPAIMNGKTADAGKGEEKPTVFAVLDSFKAPSADAPEKDKDGAEEDGDDEDGEGDEDDDEGSDADEEPPHVITDDSSVMIYIPLIPTKKSKVEMAKCDIVPVNSGAAVAKERLGSDGSNFVDVITTYRMYGTFGRGTVPPVITEGAAGGGKPLKENAITLPRFSWKFWPWKKKPATQPPVEKPAPESGSDDKKPEGDADKKPVDTKPEDGKPVDDKTPTDDKAPVGDKKPTSDDDKKKKRPHKLRKPKPILDQRVWIPSNQHVSVQALWWGYRIFLPPPVMSILSDKSIEAVKRAALITTALTWMFSHLPLKMFPAPMQPALMMLQALVPYLGYIGTFISWSWGAVKSYDLGYGVILSATWILPVALIPGSWQAYDFPTTNPPTTTPGSGTPTQPPATGTPAPTQPSTGTPAPAPANPAPTTPSGSLPPVQNAPLEPPMTIGTSAESADSEVPLTTSKRLRLVKGEGSPADEEEESEDAELDPTMSKRLKMVKGEGTKPLDPTMSTMLRVLKGVGEPVEETQAELDPTMSTRLRMVKGEGVPGDEGGEELDPTMSTRLRMVKGGETPAETGKSGYGGLWKYLSGSG
ncbi:hypothetical protein PM082_010055 [Marasmius tenuissimus]|nr:hypothetical protein PM082_010055 [Marasmius tenuissimus]